MQTPEEIYNELERQLSNSYTGLEDDDYTGLDGQDDDLDSDWIGAGPIVPGGQGGIDQFKLTITNTTGLPAVICLFPGFIPTERPVFAHGTSPNMKVYTANGAEVAVPDTFTPRLAYDALENVQRRNNAIVAVLDDGVTSDGKLYVDASDATKFIKVVPQRGSIREFVAFLKKFPTMVRNIVMEVNDVSVFSNSSFNVTRIDPYNEKGSFNISPSDFLNTNQNQDKKVVIDTLRGYKRAFQIDRETMVTMQLADLVNGSANTVASLQFNLSAPYSIDAIAFRGKSAPVRIKKAVIKKAAKKK